MAETNKSKPAVQRSIRKTRIGLVVAIVSTGIFYGLFVSKLSSSTGSGKKLVVAAKPLKSGVVLTAEDVKLVPWPAEQVPKGVFGRGNNNQ